MGDERAARRYWPALDGLRAVAVVLVVAYHADRDLVPRGGAIGVTAFFALSGFLITTLLLREREGSGRIDLRDFYRRRALRLLPALVVIVGVTTAYSLVSGDLPRTVDAALPVLGYAFNWFRAFPGDDPEGWGLLEHAWSLSVEEQFYVVWPLAVLAALGLAARAPAGAGAGGDAGTRRPVAVLVLAVAGSLASLAWRLTLWDDAAPQASAARLYNGTDTVADQLLVGAALAAGLAWWDARRAAAGRPPADGTHPTLRAVAGVGAPLALAYLVWVATTFPGGPGPDANRLYLEWGSLSFAMATLVVVVACTRAEGSWPARLLAVRPAVALGRVSYGTYLWHFPVILVVDLRLPDAPDVVRGSVVVAATAVAVAASWRLVEQPFLARRHRSGPGPQVPARTAPADQAAPVTTPGPARPSSPRR